MAAVNYKEEKVGLITKRKPTTGTRPDKVDKMQKGETLEWTRNQT